MPIATGAPPAMAVLIAALALSPWFAPAHSVCQADSLYFAAFAISAAVGGCCQFAVPCA